MEEIAVRAHASEAAFIDGAAIARSKKPTDARYVFSFRAIVEGFSWRCLEATAAGRAPLRRTAQRILERCRQFAHFIGAALLQLTGDVF
jgi:hypothetical protein